MNRKNHLKGEEICTDLKREGYDANWTIDSKKNLLLIINNKWLLAKTHKVLNVGHWNPVYIPYKVYTHNIRKFIYGFSKKLFLNYVIENPY
jgi:hypothetical protein